MPALRIRVNGIDRGQIARGAVDVQHRSAQFLFHVLRDDPGGIPANEPVLSTQDRPMHGVVGNQRQEAPIGALQPEQSNQAVYRPIGIQSQECRSANVSGPAIDIRHGDTPANPQPARGKLGSRLSNALDQGFCHPGRILRVVLVLVPLAHKDCRQTGRPDLRSGVGVRGGPPDL